MSKKSSKKPPKEPTLPRQPTSKSGAYDDPPSVIAQGQNQVGIGSIGCQGHTIHVTIIQSPPRVGSSVSDSALPLDAGEARSPAERPTTSAGQSEVLRIELVEQPRGVPAQRPQPLDPTQPAQQRAQVHLQLPIQLRNPFSVLGCGHGNAPRVRTSASRCATSPGRECVPADRRIASRSPLGTHY